MIGHNASLDPSLIEDEGGWIALARAMRDHPLVGFGRPVTPQQEGKPTYSKAEAWIDLIMECRYRAGRVINGGQVMELRRGQLLGAVSWLADRWNWSPKTVRYWLDKLEDEGMIGRFSPGIDTCPDSSQPSPKRGQQKGKQASILTITNYEIFQFVRRVEGQADWQAGGKQGASEGQARGNNKETKEQGNKLERARGNSAELPLPPSINPSDAHGKGDATVVTADMAMAHTLYNELARRIGLTQAVKLTAQRAKHLKTRLEDYGLDGWRKALSKVEASSFLRGRNDRSWRADFDFILQASSYDKILDGRYDNKKPRPEPVEAVPSDLDDMYAAMRREADDAYG